VLTEKNEDLDKKYKKCMKVVEKLESENIDQKEELDLLRNFKQQSKLQDSKISIEYDGLLKEYKEQIKRLQQELIRGENTNEIISHK
jgi:hypothetical protein